MLTIKASNVILNTERREINNKKDIGSGDSHIDKKKQKGSVHPIP